MTLRRERRQAMKLRREEKWTLTFQKSILGWMLVKARRRGRGVMIGIAIPRHVREWALAEKSLVVRDKGAIEVVTLAAKGGDRACMEANVSAPSPFNGPVAPHLDWDSSETFYLGDENDGVYYGARQDEKHPSRWWALSTVDSNTGGFVDTLSNDYGYRSRSAALRAAKDAAYEWCCANEIKIEEYPSTEAVS